MKDKHTLLNKAKKYLTNAEYRFRINNSLGLYNGMSDEEFLMRKYRRTFGRELNLESPETFTEKLQWIKLNDRNPLYTVLVDKYAAKDYVASVIGADYIIPTLGVWDSAEEVELDALPEQFVLKCTHNSGLGMCICTDKSQIDAQKVRKKLSAGLKQDFYITGREWPYKNVPHRIIAEKYMVDERDGELRDYKFFCFNGIPKVVYITQGRGKSGDTVADFFDMDFNHIDMRIDHETASIPPHMPENFELMKELAKKLAAGIPHVRVDFYEVNGQVYFGELTFFHCAGFAPFSPPEYDELWGSWIELQAKTKE